MDSIVEEYVEDDDGDDDDCKKKGVDDDDDEMMIRNYYYHSSWVQQVRRDCIVFVDVELKRRLTWNWDQMVKDFVRECDACWESE